MSGLHHFNNDSKSWQIYAKNLQSRSGDDLNLATTNTANKVLLNVSGSVETGSTSVIGTLSVTNDATLNSNLVVSGETTSNSLTITNAANVGSTLSVSGDITANAYYGDGSQLSGIQTSFTNYDDASFNNMDISGKLHINDVDICGNLKVYGSGVFANHVVPGNNDSKIVNTFNNYSFASHNQLLTNLTTTGNTWIDLKSSGYDISYNPLSDKSKIFIHGKINYIASTESEQLISFQLIRTKNGSESILFTDLSFGSLIAANINNIYTFDYLDSPDTDSNVSYHLKFMVHDDGNNIDIPCGILGFDDSNINCFMLHELYIPPLSGIIDAINNTINTSSSIVLNSYGDVSLGYIELSGHIIPTINDNFDIGSAEFKIRDLYVADNSIFIGDKNKLSVDDTGNLMLMERDDEIIPSGVFENITSGFDHSNSTNVLNDINSKLGKSLTQLKDIKLQDWQKYSDHLTSNAGQSRKNMNQIYKPTTNSDWKQKKTIVNILNEYSDASFGNIDLCGNIIPTIDNFYTLGNPNYAFKDVYIGPGSLYVNNKKVIEDDNDTIKIKTDEDQNLTIKTTGSGLLKIESHTSTVIDASSSIDLYTNLTNVYSDTIRLNDNVSLNTETNNGKIIFNGATEFNKDSSFNNNLFVENGLYVNSSSINSYLYSGTNLFIDPAAHGDNTGKVYIKGDLEVQGTTTKINSTTLDICDNRIKLNGAATIDAGIDVSFNDGTSASLLYSKTLGAWTTNKVKADNYLAGGRTIVSATAQANFRDLELKDNNNNQTLQMDGATGDISTNGFIKTNSGVNTDIINEMTLGSGVTVAGVELFGNKVKADNYLAGSRTIVSATAQANFLDLELKDNNNNQTLQMDGATGDISTNGIITATKYYGDGSNLTGIQTSLTNHDDASFNNVDISGILTATKYYGDGSNLTGIQTSLTNHDDASLNNVDISGILTFKGGDFSFNYVPGVSPNFINSFDYLANTTLLDPSNNSIFTTNNTSMDITYSPTLNIFVNLRRDSVLYSYDGISWYFCKKSDNSNFSFNGKYRGIVEWFGGNVNKFYICATHASNSIIYYSSDGINWTNVTIYGETYGFMPLKLAYSPTLNKIVATGSGNGNGLWVADTSGSNLDFTLDASAGNGFLSQLLGSDGEEVPIIWDSNLEKFILTTKFIGSGKQIYYNADNNLISWTLLTNIYDFNNNLTTDGTLNKICYSMAFSPTLNRSVFVGIEAIYYSDFVGGTAISNLVFKETRDINGTNYSGGPLYRKIIWDSDSEYFIIAAHAGSHDVIYSANGINWFSNNQETSTPSGYLARGHGALAYGDGKLILTGHHTNNVYQTDSSYIPLQLYTSKGNYNFGHNNVDASFNNIDCNRASFNNIDCKRLEFSMTNSELIGQDNGIIQKVQDLSNGFGSLLISNNVSGLTDTNLSNLQDGDVLEYNSAAAKWINATPSSGGPVTIAARQSYKHVTNLASNIDYVIGYLSGSDYCETQFEYPSGFVTSLYSNGQNTTSGGGQSRGGYFKIPSDGVYNIYGIVHFNLSIEGANIILWYKRGAAAAVKIAENYKQNNNSTHEQSISLNINSLFDAINDDLIYMTIGNPNSGATTRTMPQGGDSAGIYFQIHKI